MGWELRTTKDGIPFYVDHVRGATTWERPELPSYEQVARPLPKHCLPAAKRSVVSGRLAKYFPKGCAASTSGSGDESTFSLEPFAKETWSSVCGDCRRII
mmetsp:Transcript_61972/g.102902  ORF Transcript_61972/g.102902 Transcript_61972/m.102902 type:complete len:100 (-) Transcript_61972:145-444(-)